MRKTLDNTTASRGRRPECEAVVACRAAANEELFDLYWPSCRYHPLFAAFSAYLHSSEFHALACHSDAAQTFTRRRKLPVPALVAVMLSGMRKSVQTELDEFSPTCNSRRNGTPRIRAGVRQGPHEAGRPCHRRAPWTPQLQRVPLLQPFSLPRSLK